MKTIETICYKTSDGDLFESERKASEHQENILGEALDDLLPHDDRGNVTYIDRFNLLKNMMDDPKLVSKIGTIYHALNFQED